ncbi:MAG: hypothetical protein WCG33_04190, partial [Actinomycetes bacterium]
MNPHLLARIQIPAPGFSEPTLYVRHQHGSLSEAGLTLSKGGRATFDTAFGAFASGRWSRLTKISDIGVSMDISGHCLVELIAYANSSETVIASSDE